MKRFLLTIVTIFCCLSGISADELESLFDADFIAGHPFDTFKPKIGEVSEPQAVPISLSSLEGEPFAEMMRQKLREIGPDGKCILYAFSQGGQLVNSLRHYLTPDQLRQIHVRTFGSAKMISDNAGFGSAYNYVCLWDPVPIFSDPIGLVRSLFDRNMNVEFIPRVGNPLTVHQFLGPTYNTIIKHLGNGYTNQIKSNFN